MNLEVVNIDDLKLSKFDIMESWHTLGHCERYFQTKLFCDYYQGYFGLNYELRFLVIVDSNNQDYIYGIVAYTISNSSKKVTYFDHPIDVIWFRRVKNKSYIYELVINKFKTVLDEFYTLKLAENFEFFKNGEIKNEICAIVDLKLSEEEIYFQVRKSYRSLINWGKREMVIEIYDARSADCQKFESFRQFHIRVSGRETRPKSTWDKQFEMIKQNQAYLILAYFQNNLVSGSLNFFTHNECFYGVGVNDRELMGKKHAIGHWTIMKSILMAKELGILRYNLGAIGPDEIFADQKEKNIAVFKSGFTNFKVENKFFLSRLIESEIGNCHSE